MTFTSFKFEKGDLLRVRSFTNQVWDAKVVDVDEDERKIKISYIAFSGDFEEWVRLDSDRIDQNSVNNSHGFLNAALAV